MWRAHATLSRPVETVTPTRTTSGDWSRSDEDRGDTFAIHLQNLFHLNPASASGVLPIQQRVDDNVQDHIE